MSQAALNARSAIVLLATLPILSCSTNEPIRPVQTISRPPPHHDCFGCAAVNNRVAFEYDSSALDTTAIHTLAKQARWLKRHPKAHVRIAGYADDRGTEEYDLALGARRANAVRDYLVAQGIAPSRIVIISYGRDRPRKAGIRVPSSAENRYVETLVR